MKAWHEEDFFGGMRVPPSGGSDVSCQPKMVGLTDNMKCPDNDIMSFLYYCHCPIIQEGPALQKIQNSTCRM